jgi:aryl-alcohol dehydrogenase-like predicted oxidoreductase
VVPRRALGASGIDVSSLSLGSWRTYERIPREDGIAVMTAAREYGIDFLDDARYNDETGAAPRASGYSEVVFGELFRAAGWRRDEVVVANKLWWEFWPDETAAQELEGSLGRMALDYLDLVYAAEPPKNLEIAEMVGSISGLIAAGKLRAWGVLNWPPHLLVEAAEFARREQLPPPCAAQVPYNLVLRSPVEDAQAAAAFDRSGACVVASMPLWFGALTGKYLAPNATGRIADQLESARLQDALAAVEPLRKLADDLDTTPAALAIAFSLGNRHVASVLFGATRPQQVLENVTAADVLARLSDSDLAALRSLGTPHG